MTNSNMIRLALTLTPLLVGWMVAALKDGRIDLNEWIELARMVSRQLGVPLDIPAGSVADQRTERDG
ncbi:MAG: hypothetical protein U1F68_15000 [Gammaproteobacteria bacterium]